MRKYQQLLLLIVSIYCFITLLFYRNEYLKLRSALVILNFFGSVPATNSSSCVVLGGSLKKGLVRTYNYLEPRSSWTKFDRHSIYSSFYENGQSDNGYVRTLAIGPISSFSNYQCRVWFEEGDKIISYSGTFKYDLDIQSKTISAKQALRKYFLKCYFEKRPEFGYPYGVLWITPSASSNVFSPVFVKKRAPDEPVICVKADYSGFAKTNIVEFLSYYTKIGVSNFIIYDSGIQHSLYPLLESIAQRTNLLQGVTVLRWNFPETDNRLESLSLKDDCLSRTFGVSKLVAIVAWNEFIIPDNGDINSLRRNSATDFVNLSLDTWLCCTNYPDDKSSKSSWPEFLRKTRCAPVLTEETAYLNHKSYVNARKNVIYRLPSQLATKRRFDACDKLPADSIVVPLSTQFNDVATHKLLQTWKSYLNTSAIFY